MKFKTAARRSAVIIIIIALSAGFGFLFQGISDRAQRSKYPMPQEYSSFVEKYANEYGVPQYVVYAVIKCESNFDRGLDSEDGSKVGLMQFPKEQLDAYREELGDSDVTTDALYGPETNIKYGTYRLSKLRYKVGEWKSVYAAMYSGTDKVLEWLGNEEYANIPELGRPSLVKIPDEGCSKYVEKLEKCEETYYKLYFEN